MTTGSRSILPRRGETTWLHWMALGTLSFIAALLAVALAAGGQLAADWSTRMQGSATVAVQGEGLESADAAAARASEILSSVKGVERAWILEPRRADGLIAALIETKAATVDAPAAPLIAVSFAPGAHVDARSLGRLLRANGLTAGVDDHSLGASPIWRATAVVVAVVLASWLMLALGAFAVVRRAARRSLRLRGDVVDLLHISGAGDGYIANLFRVRIGSQAGLAAGAGVLAATVVAAGWRLAAPPGPAWLDLAAPLPWLAIATATAIGAVTLSTRAVLKPRP